MLETEIKKLTEAVTMLNETMMNFHPGRFLLAPDQRDELIEAHAEADAIVEQIKIDDMEDEVHPNQAEMTFDEESTTLTHDDLKDACLTKVREDMKFKPMVKALLAEYGATKAVDVPSDKIGEVIEKIEAMV